VQTVLFEQGTQIGGPITSKFGFDAESGKLSCKGPQAEVEKEETIFFEGRVSGKLKLMGFSGQELLIAK
jgi:hypothetical protein